jgi:hypothetical protein
MRKAEAAVNLKPLPVSSANVVKQMPLKNRKKKMQVQF